METYFRRMETYFHGVENNFRSVETYFHRMEKYFRSLWLWVSVKGIFRRIKSAGMNKTMLKCEVNNKPVADIINNLLRQRFAGAVAHGNQFRPVRAQPSPQSNAVYFGCFRQVFHIQSVIICGVAVHFSCVVYLRQN